MCLVYETIHPAVECTFLMDIWNIYKIDTMLDYLKIFTKVQMIDIINNIFFSNKKPLVINNKGIMTKFSYICMDHPKGWWDCGPTALSYSVVRINSLWNSVCHYPSKLKEYLLMKNQICCFVYWYLKVHSLKCDHSHTTIGASSRLDLSWGCLLKDLCVASPGGLASPYGSCLPRMSNL